MKKKLQIIIKYFPFLYNIYFYLLSAGINVMKLFVKPDDKLILFNSFGGKKYDDSPRSVFEQMKEDSRFEGYKFVWAFHEPQKFSVEGAEVIKTDGLKYYITALKARCWITNSGIERGLSFKGKNTFFFNTWHGTPIKMMGTDAVVIKKSFKPKGKSHTDLMAVQSDYEVEVFSRAWNRPREKFLLCGLPRNDRLANYTEAERADIRKKLGISEDKAAVLYAPTFREYERDRTGGCVLEPPIDLNKWKNRLGDKYCILFRAHYEVSKAMEIKDNGFVFNMTDYPSLEDLMIAADILISDYSSIIVDFSIMDKPMFHFTYDYDQYSENRGMYFDIREYLDGANNEDELIDLLTEHDKDKEINKTKAFRAKFVNYYGDATQKVIDCVYEKIKGV